MSSVLRSRVRQPQGGEESKLSPLWRRALAPFDTDDAVLLVALGFVSVGAGLVWLPAAFLAPGLVLLWLVLPSRAAFITRPPSAKSNRIAPGQTPVVPAVRNPHGTLSAGPVGGITSGNFDGT